MSTEATTTASRRQQRPMLAVDDIHVYYGNIAAVKGISLEVRQGEIVTLIGSNGAGKSTTMRTISGLCARAAARSSSRAARSAACRATR